MARLLICVVKLLALKAGSASPDLHWLTRDSGIRPLPDRAAKRLRRKAIFNQKLRYDS